MRPGRKSWHLINAFAREENANYRKTLALNGPHPHGPGSRRAAGEGKGGRE